MSFEKALAKVLKHEGGYVNHKDDNGGETFRGISRKFYPKSSIWSILDTYEDKDDAMHDEEVTKMVASFYRNYYWLKIKADEIHDPFVASMVFNFAINSGKRAAVKKIQRIVGTKTDGLIGNITLGALNAVDPKVFTHHFLLEIFEFYTQIARKGNNHVFLQGWCNRASNMYYDAERYFKALE